jgi:ceramide glucosyltransferase
VSRFFELALLAATGLGLSLVSVAALITVYRLRMRINKSHASGPRPAVSIFKPLKGAEDNLEENLRSFFELEYPEFELLFAVRNPHDPAVAIVERLRTAYPRVPSRLVIGPEVYGLNPKVNNLIHLYPHARHDYLLISDSNVRVVPSYLTDLMFHLQKPGVGLVTSTIRGVGAVSAGALLENLHLNTYVAPAVFSTRILFGRPIVIGKSMLFSRRELQQLGGFQAFVNLLAEDQLIGAGIQRLGLRIKTTPLPVNNVNVSWSLEQLYNRHVRWGMIRKNLSPGLYLLEILGNPVTMVCAYALVCGRPEALSVCAVVALCKIAVDLLVGRAMGSDLHVLHYFLVPIKDLFMAYAWAVPFFKRHVNWRGNHLRIGRNTALSPASGSAL